MGDTIQRGWGYQQAYDVELKYLVKEIRDRLKKEYKNVEMLKYVDLNKIDVFECHGSIDEKRSNVLTERSFERELLGYTINAKFELLVVLNNGDKKLLHKEEIDLDLTWDDFIRGPTNRQWFIKNLDDVLEKLYEKFKKGFKKYINPAGYYDEMRLKNFRKKYGPHITLKDLPRAK